MADVNNNNDNTDDDPDSRFFNIDYNKAQPDPFADEGDAEVNNNIIDNNDDDDDDNDDEEDDDDSDDDDDDDEDDDEDSDDDDDDDDADDDEYNDEYDNDGDDIELQQGSPPFLGEEDADPDFGVVAAKVDDPNWTVLDYFIANAEGEFGKNRFMTQPMGQENKNTMKYFTYAEVLEEAKKVAMYLESLEYPPKSNIAICSKNCAWWIIADLGIWMAGHVSVPIYPTLTPEMVQHTLEHSESKLLFIGKMDKRAWYHMKRGVPSMMDKVSFPLCPEDALDASPWEEVITTMEPQPTIVYDEETKEEHPIVRPTKDELATIIYTSGTTGEPKGVMTSFKAMTDTTKGISALLNINEKDRYFSFLPIAHGMERWLGMCVPLYTGMQLYYADSQPSFVTDLNRCQPTLFMSVPRLWKKFQWQALNRIGSQQKLDSMINYPLGLGNYYKKQTLKSMGLGSCRFAGSGSAPLPGDLLVWYQKLGLNLLEGYGQTENFNYSHISLPDNTRIGYVGNTYWDVNCRIAVDGEIQIRTPGAMMGYFNDPIATDEAITEDGWIRTGDKGILDEEDRLKITGRASELFRTSEGMLVAPGPIEKALVSNPIIGLACVLGRNQPEPFAVLQLSDEYKIKMSEFAYGSGGQESLIEEIDTELEEYLEKVNEKFDDHEHLAYLVLANDVEWLDSNGFLTPMQKIKRNVIENHYQEKIYDWYISKHRKVIWDGM